MSVPTSDALDQANMARLAANQDAALNELMERHREPLFHYLLRLLQNETEAADLAQETFVRVYQHRHRFSPGKKFTTWIYTIATNLARDRQRWRARHPHVSLEAQNEATGISLGETLPEHRPNPSETLQAAERADCVRHAVTALPDKLRLPLILAEYEGRSQAEIAEILECSVKAVETRLARARQQLRAQLVSCLAGS